MAFIKVKANSDPNTDLYLNTDRITYAAYANQVITVYYDNGMVYSLDGITQEQFEEMIGIPQQP